jgi:hypothetical protein
MHEVRCEVHESESFVLALEHFHTDNPFLERRGNRFLQQRGVNDYRTSGTMLVRTTVQGERPA